MDRLLLGIVGRVLAVAVVMVLTIGICYLALVYVNTEYTFTTYELYVGLFITVYPILYLIEIARTINNDIYKFDIAMFTITILIAIQLAIITYIIAYIVNIEPAISVSTFFITLIAMLRYYIIDEIALLIRIREYVEDTEYPITFKDLLIYLAEYGIYIEKHDNIGIVNGKGEIFIEENEDILTIETTHYTMIIDKYTRDILVTKIVYDSTEE